ncbi:hypothetical protein ACFMBG_06985 [Leisingera sp. D0M16]|uniref:hypothetical protein n=1 Tax=Leisingera coralii TaxID=3351347 RepID=UPI003B7DD066
MKILHDGIHLFDVSGFVPLAEACSQAQGVISEGYDAGKVERIPVSAEETRALIREGIAASAGDTLSLLGTASDGSALALYHLAALIKGLHSAQSLEEVRAAAAAFEPVASSFLAKVEAGDVKLPFLVKGEAEVMAEIENRATAVSEALTK